MSFASRRDARTPVFGRADPMVAETVVGRSQVVRLTGVDPNSYTCAWIGFLHQTVPTAGRSGLASEYRVGPFALSPRFGSRAG